MKSGLKILAAAAPLALFAMPALAQDDARYQMEKTADGYVRLDKQTGDMSICKEQSGQMICRSAADDRASLSDQIMQLEGRLAKLEAKVASGERSGVSGNSGLPTDEEFEKTMGYMEKFFRRFMGVVKDLNEDPQLNRT